MAIKGAQAKNEITAKILETFPGSFLYNDGKEIRINTTENGEAVQIKVALTCAKAPVGLEEDSAPPASTSIAKTFEEKNENNPDEPSEEEKERLAKLLKGLGF